MKNYLKKDFGDLSKELVKFLQEEFYSIKYRGGFVIYVPSIEEIEAKRVLSDSTYKELQKLILECEDKPNLLVEVV